jgi:hypothetical protein
MGSTQNRQFFSARMKNFSDLPGVGLLIAEMVEHLSCGFFVRLIRNRVIDME